MDKLDKLFEEAKPLYRTRKRRKTIFKLLVVICLPMFALTSVTQLYLEGSDLYASLDKDTIQNKLLEDEFGLLELN